MMSCFVMEPRALACMAEVIGRLLNVGYNSFGFEAPRSLYDALKDCNDATGFYNERYIYARLYTLNARAYAKRYREPEDTTPPDVDFSGLDIWERPEPNGHYGHAVKPWHYRFLKLVDCYNYQTDSGDEKDPLKKAMDELAQILCLFIVRNAAEYDAAPWGRF